MRTPPPFRRWLAALGLLAPVLAAHGKAEVYPLPPAEVDLVGQIQIEPAQHEDTFLDIARRTGLGYDEIVAANPGVDRWLPGDGMPVVLPTQHVLPAAPREGIVVNIPEMRLYYYPRGSGTVKTYAVSIGRMDWKTPLGRTSVTAKQVNPSWYPPASIKAEHAAKGDPLPDVVPGGPDNPLGTRAMRLGIPGYLIHGTNNPNGIGMRVTHGCIRMYPEDVEALFPDVPVGTPVTLVNQTWKLGRGSDGTVYLEYHSPLEEDQEPTEQQVAETVQAVRTSLGATPLIAPDIVDTVVRQASGLPVAITPPAPAVAQAPLAEPPRVPVSPAAGQATAAPAGARPLPAVPAAARPRP